MPLPSRLVVFSCYAGGDGGALLFGATDEHNVTHSIFLTQSEYLSSRYIPGLYFDDELIPLRSDREAGIIALLRQAEVRDRSPDGVLGGQEADDELRETLHRVIKFVESPEYVLFAAAVEKTNQSADQ